MEGVYVPMKAPGGLIPCTHAGAHNHLPHDAEPSKCSACLDQLSRSFAFPYMRKGKRPPSPPKPYVPPIVYDPNNPHLTSDDLRTAKRIADEQVGRIEVLKGEVAALKEQLGEAQTTNREVSSFLNGEILSKEQKTRRLQSSLEERTQSAERNMLQLRAQMQDQLLQQRAEFDKIESELRSEVSQLKADNQQLLGFRAQQKQMDTLVSSLREDIRVKRDELERQAKDWGHRFESTKASLQEEYTTALENAREDARVAARAELEEGVLVQQRLKVQLSKELEDHQVAFEEWQEEKVKLEQDREALSADKALVSMQLQSNGQQLTLAHQHNSELYQACKTLKDKVEHLLCDLESMQAASQEQESADANASRMAREERGRLEQAAATLQKGIQDIQKLSRRILKKRSPLEVALIQAIEGCRDRLTKEHQKKKQLEHEEWLSLVRNGATPRLTAVKGGPTVSDDADPSLQGGGGASRAAASQGSQSARGPPSTQLALRNEEDGPTQEEGQLSLVEKDNPKAPGIDRSAAGRASIYGIPWRERERILRELFRAVNEAAGDENAIEDPLLSKLNSLCVSPAAELS